MNINDITTDTTIAPIFIFFLLLDFEEEFEEELGEEFEEEFEEGIGLCVLLDILSKTI
jgi:hypothetical protein